MRTGVDERASYEASGCAVVGTRWGAVGLVERDGAVIALTLADDEAAAREALSAGSPAGTPTERARELADEVACRIEAGEDFDGIPFEAAGTDFQEAVWRELILIPRGEVVTYAELARRIGRPGASRAVGSACGANPVALLIPCHRVVPADGAVGGYRWGASRKEAILAGEGVTIEAWGVS